MKKMLLGMMALMMLVLSGCGDGSVAVAVVVPIGPVISPPSITSYQFTKDPAAEFIDGSVTFYAPDADIDKMTIAVFDPDGKVKSRSETYVYLAGVVHGTIPFSIDYATYPSEARPYTISVYLTDSNGYTSNQAVDTFYVP